MVNARRARFVGRLTLAAVAVAAILTTTEGARASEPLMSRAASRHQYMRPPAVASSRVTASANVQYYGGHVISHVQVVPVNWGATVTPSVATGAAGFYAAIVDSPYLDWMGEYDTVGKNGTDGLPGSNQHIYRGTALPTVTITPASTGGYVTDSAVQQELQAQITAGKLPAPQTDREGGVNTIYMVNFGPEVVVDDGSGQPMCDAWCAYHGSMSVSGVSGQVPYAIIPDFSQRCTQCGQGGGPVAVFGHAASHELAEAISDAEVGAASQSSAPGRPLAWIDPSDQEGEIGDICSTEETSLGGYTVQKEWSQRLGQCISQDSALTLCTGANRPCRTCTASDCTGATPTCNRDVTSPKWGQCTGCTTNASCTTTGKNVCDTTAGTCVGCLTNADCNGGTCDTATHTCVASGTSSGSSGGASSSGGTSGGAGSSGSSGSSGGASSSSGASGDGASSSGDGSSGGAGPKAGGCTQSGALPGSNAPGLLGLGLALALMLRRRRPAP